MHLALHQNSSIAAGFRGSLEGWSRAGITHGEITSDMLDGFLASDSVVAARRLASDLGLTLVGGACGVNGLLEPGSHRASALDAFRRRCDEWALLGLPRIYATTASTRTPDLDDYARAPEFAREAGDIAASHGLTMMFEFLRSSSFIATLPTMLQVTRAAAHPTVGVLFDCYHFWSGLNKSEDLDDVRDGEIWHVHFQDTARLPRERLDATTRAIAGDGVAPLVAILKTLQAKGYDAALSVEMFSPAFQQRDPFDLATEVKAKSERVMRQAGVL